MGSPGLENLRWLKPVYPGDTLTPARTRIIESRAAAHSAPDIGLVRSRLGDVQPARRAGAGDGGLRHVPAAHPATPEEIARWKPRATLT